jgi:hypothetical protein
MTDTFKLHFIAFAYSVHTVHTHTHPATPSSSLPSYDPSTGTHTHTQSIRARKNPDTPQSTPSLARMAREREKQWVE